MINYKLICDEEQIEIKKPTLSLMVIKSNGEVYESDSIRGVMCAVVGREYEDNEDETDDWNFRVMYARKMAMSSLRDNINVVVHDIEKGIIKNNYAAALDDEDYIDDIQEYAEEINVEVGNEKDFLKSLAKLGAILIYEREDSHQFLEDNIQCQECSHGKIGVCAVYKFKIEAKDNRECSSGTKCNIDECKVGVDYKLIE